MPSANFLLIARKVFQHLETVQNDTKRREKPKIHWAKLTQNEAEYSVRESYGKELFVLLSGRSEVRIPSGVPKERDIRKDVPFLWPPAAGNGCLPGNFKYPRADAVCASIRVISGRRR